MSGCSKNTLVGHPAELLGRYRLAVSLAKSFARQLSMSRMPVRVSDKDDGSPVTERDLAFSDQARQRITGRYPADNVICEEGAKSPLPTSWIVDPIDGTALFANGLLPHAVSIAYFQNNVPVFAAVAIPGRKGFDVVSCLSGKGIYVNDKRFVPARPKRFLGAIEFSQPDRTLAQKFPEIFGMVEELCVFGSSVYASSSTCLGKTSFFIHAGPKLWDVAASLVFYKEAGLVANIVGFDLAQIAKNNWRLPLFIIAQNREVLSKLLRIIG